LHNHATGDGGGINALAQLTITASTVAYNTVQSPNGSGGGAHAGGAVDVTSSTFSNNFAPFAGGALYASATAPTTLRHSTFSYNSSNVGGGVFVPTGTLNLDHTILALNTAPIGPDLTGFIGLQITANHSLVGDNANSGLAASINGAPDANGNLIGPTLSFSPLVVDVEMAAMGDFEAGAAGDSYKFEYSIDGGDFQPLFISSVNEAGNQLYILDNGIPRFLDDPLVVNGVTLNNRFQTLSAVIPGGGSSIRIRFTAVNSGAAEAFAWRNLFVRRQSSGVQIGAAVQYYDFFDQYAAYTADADFAVGGDMFGIRSRVSQGVPSLPFDIVDDSYSIFPNDVQGIISEFDYGRFFGAVDGDNRAGRPLDSAVWTFDNPAGPLDPLLGPLTDNGGPTWTHELLPGSPAIDAGNAALQPGVGETPLFDQRDAPFSRFYNGDGVGGAVVDIGAFEQQSGVGVDLDLNGEVDGRDFLAWQRGFGMPAPQAAKGDGDADGDHDVDADDLTAWKMSFGALPSLAAAASSSASAATRESSAAPNVQAIDAAMAYLQLMDAPSRPLFRARTYRAR
jgi:predicted outer membrane repeat protein